MNSNFDCTQMISISKNSVAEIPIDAFANFEALGFDIIFDGDISDVKKDYFNKKNDEYFIELVNKEFCGEFEDWLLLEEPPELISEFVNAINSFMIKNDLGYIKVFVSFFAEKGVSTDYLSETNVEELTRSLFLMSKNNFDIWVDNLILKINFQG